MECVASGVTNHPDNLTSIEVTPTYIYMSNGVGARPNPAFNLAPTDLERIYPMLQRVVGRVWGLG